MPRPAGRWATRAAFAGAFTVAAVVWHGCAPSKLPRPGVGSKRPLAVAVKFERRQSAVAGTTQHTLTTTDGRKRRYLLHVPPNYDPRRPLPLVLAFHGGGGKAETIVAQSRLDAVADQYGFLVVYPDGTGRLRLLTFNAGTCCGYAVKNQVDDVAFVAQLLDALPKQVALDTHRVYATGMSNGAMLCYRLACELPERIAAIAPVAGTLSVEGPAPSVPVPIIHFHGGRDENVRFDGGLGANQYEKTPHRAVRETLAFFIRANGCREEVAEVEQAADFVRERWQPPTGVPGAPVELYLLPQGGHTWPGGVDTTRWLGTGPIVASVDASRLMWQFFRQFSR